MILVLVVLVSALSLGGCADQPLVSDEEYNATHGPAAAAADPMQHVPQPVEARDKFGGSY